VPVTVSVPPTVNVAEPTLLSEAVAAEAVVVKASEADRR
jgi:hypothetical protein